MKRKTIWMISSGANALGIRMTEAERRAGRLLRAPDHDGSTAGDGGAGDGAGSEGGEGAGEGSGGDAVSGAGEGAGSQDGAGDSGGGEGNSDGQSAADDGGAGGDAPGGEDKTILGGALDDEGGSDAGKSEGETRLQFGEGEAVKDILGAPEAYAVELPDALKEAGVTFDKEAFEAVEPILRDLNLSNDAAQALTAAYAEKIMPLLAKRAGEANDALGADMRRQWATDAEKEFDGKEGRASLTEVKALTRQAFIRGGIKADSPFLKLLEESGLGSHPDMVRTMAFFGRAVGEAGIEQGGSSEPPMRTADKIYGKPVPRD